MDKNHTFSSVFLLIYLYKMIRIIVVYLLRTELENSRLHGLLSEIEP